MNTLDEIRNLRLVVAELNRLLLGIRRSAGGGESNTASNVGSAGTGLFDSKAGVDLQFRKINALSNKLSIALDTANKKVDLDVDPSKINLNDLGDVNAGAPADDDVLTWDAGTTKWIAQAGGGGGGGGGGGLMAYRRSGRLYTVGSQYTPYNLTTVAPTLSNLYAGPFIISGANQVFDLIGIYVNTGRVNGALRLAVYDDDGDCYPNNLLYGTAELDGTTAGEKSEAIGGGGLTLSQGLYWLAFNSTGDSALTVRAVTYIYAVPSVFGFENFTDTVAEKIWQVAQAYGAMPASFPGGATLQPAVHPPAVMLRLA